MLPRRVVNPTPAELFLLQGLRKSLPGSRKLALLPRGSAAPLGESLVEAAGRTEAHLRGDIKHLAVRCQQQAPRVGEAVLGDVVHTSALCTRAKERAPLAHDARRGFRLTDETYTLICANKVDISQQVVEILLFGLL